MYVSLGLNELSQIESCSSGLKAKIIQTEIVKSNIYIYEYIYNNNYYQYILHNKEKTIVNSIEGTTRHIQNKFAKMDRHTRVNGRAAIASIPRTEILLFCVPTVLEKDQNHKTILAHGNNIESRLRLGNMVVQSTTYKRSYISIRK